MRVISSVMAACFSTLWIFLMPLADTSSPYRFVSQSGKKPFINPDRVVYLSDLKEISVANIEYGLGKDKAPWEADQGLKIVGELFSRGIVTHPPNAEEDGGAVGRVEYDLAGDYDIFSAVVGRVGKLDPSICKDSKAMRYRVIVDGKLIANGDFNNVQQLSVKVSQAKRLVLEVDDGGDGYWCDHAGWGDAKLILGNKPEGDAPKPELKLIRIDADGKKEVESELGFYGGPFYLEVRYEKESKSPQKQVELEMTSNIASATGGVVQEILVYRLDSDPSVFRSEEFYIMPELPSLEGVSE